MNEKETARRHFLIGAITFSGVASTSIGASFLTSIAAWADETREPDAAAMARLARLLFPHDGLADSVYAEVMSQVLEQTAADPATTGLLAAAEAALNQQRGVPWVELGSAAQLAALKELENEAFMVGVREIVRYRLYNHPDLWKHIDYPGSSKEYGGYINRGFDDIDWLPEAG